MEKAQILAQIIGPFYLILGLSILLYVEQWKKLMKDYAGNHFAMLPLYTLELILGLIIVNMYNVWAWDLMVIVTLTGWGAILESLFYFLAPASWIKGFLKGKMASESSLYFWGAVFTVIGVLLSYNAYLV